MTLDGFRSDDVYYDKMPEKPKREPNKVPYNIEQCFFLETKVTS